MNKKVSVVIPFFNGVDWLCDAIQSVLDQTYNNLEIIVVNDGSPENVDDFLAKYGDKIIYILKENGGPASARNLGIDKATGEYIAFLDSDDIWLNNKIEKQISLMEISKAIWSHTSYSLFLNKEQSKVFKRIDVADYKGMIFPKCLHSSPIATPCVMIKASYLKNNPHIRFAEHMRYGEDSYLWSNLAVHNHLYVVPDALTKVRIRGTNSSSDVRAYLSARAQFWMFIIENRMPCFDKSDVPTITKTAMCMCYYAEIILLEADKKKVFNKALIDNLAKILYAIPYIIFKTYYYTTLNRK
jgi:glycosyltransferase involved in cell wall biosynthesis